MSRHPQWRGRLAAAVTAAPDRPFAWGEWDCAVFACTCLEAVTGLDYYAPFRGQYSTEDGARAALAAAGYADLPAVAARHFTEIHPSRASVGDLAAIAVGDAWSLGVVIGERVAVLHPKGYATVPRSLMSRAFRV